ncbi:hypothetical protein MLD38_026452 [Melastoma candidum]|uniref:Uncharacterized protein n=1 Tax=Melastoma candidum TaxID=119954 RepID=A0ACB9NZ58_9MYRT|nr:hypothetical protein MLD38_026452 [Melastoma candidum]
MGDGDGGRDEEETTELPSLWMNKKASRSWVSVNQEGDATVLDVDKHEIMRRVRIHARDLRILDPMLSYPSKILGREMVIVVNLEHIKAIITADEVLLRDPEEPLVIPIIEELRRRLPLANAISSIAVEEEEQQEVSNSEEMGNRREFPFEFRALEVALEGICSFLDAQTRELEMATYPALDELTSKISSRNLDRVRKLKSAMTRLTSRVQKVRDELEELLNDDGDMAELYLSRKLPAVTSPVSNNGVSDWYLASPTTGSKISKNSKASALSTHDENDIEELEMLLEAYFMQIEGTMNKLTTLREYIDDTEDYINIQLDNHRNQLIQLELFLLCGSMCLSVYSLVAAIFGMNIPYGWREGHGYIFKWVVILTGIVSGSVFFSVISYAHHKGSKQNSVVVPLASINLFSFPKFNSPYGEKSKRGISIELPHWSVNGKEPGFHLNLYYLSLSSVDEAVLSSSEEDRAMAEEVVGNETGDDYDDGDGGAGGGRGGKGTWKHAAFHLATTIATPAAYAPLPFALASLGWPLGVSSLVSATLATWYSSLLVASLWRWNGNRQVTYRHLAQSIFGSKGYLSIAFFQQVASLGNNIAVQIAAGSSLKAVYKYYHEDGPLTLQHFIIFFGVFELILSQLPDIHSLRWVNAICTFCTICFAATTIGVSIYNGKDVNRETVNYSLQGSSSERIFKAFNALGTIAFSFGDAMLPEIQNTVKEPAKNNMYKGVSAAYTVIVVSYWQLAFTGYWAFGSQVQPYVVNSLRDPKWTVIMANIFAVIQISGCFQIYCRPTYACFEESLLSGRHAEKDGALSRDRLIRLIFTSIYMTAITLIAAAMPFFGDFVAICGAVGFTPLDFVFPAIAYLKAGKTPKSSVWSFLLRLVNICIATWFSVVAILGCIGAIRFIKEDVKTYNFFHDM